jgi:phosphomannomutase
MEFPKHIFRSYDIRGLVGTEVTPELGYRLGRAFALFLEKKGIDISVGSVVVGRDMRPSGVDIQHELMRGLMDSGATVVDIGMVSTPLFGFASAHFEEYIAGITVTASHNPSEYNGFKLSLGDGSPIGGGSGLMDIRDMMERNEFPEITKRGGMSTFNPIEDYLSRVSSFVSTDSVQPMKIVIDAGNGMADVTYPELVQRIPNLEAEFMYLTPDGTFPNHEANPLKVETLRDLQARVLEVGADFGFALDGDADRLGLVDERGRVVEPSVVGAIIGMEVLRDYPSSHMLYDLRSSDMVSEVWESRGATTTKSMVGHANIKHQMRDEGAVYASELSLHLYYRDMYFLECGELSLMYILRLLGREQRPLSQLVADLPSYAHSGEINFEFHDKKSVRERVYEKYSPLAIEQTDIDGLWLRMDWGWMSLRESNTEDVIRLNLETKDRDMTKRKIEEIRGIIVGG